MFCQSSWRLPNWQLGFLRLCTLIAGCLCTLLAGCQHSAKPQEANPSRTDTPLVLSTIAPVEVLVSAVGGSRIRSECLIAGELDPHSYQLAKGDREKFRRAELVFYNGLGLEHGPSLASSLASCSKAVSLGDWLATNRPEDILRTGGLPDPHMWMDVQLWSRFLDCICEHLTAIEPQFGEEFRHRTENLRAEFAQTHSQICNLIHQIPAGQRYLVTTHDAFSYFARAYLSEPAELALELWRHRVMSPEGLAPESQISLQQMQRTLRYLIDHKVEVVFAESNINYQSLMKITQAARAQNVPIEVAEQKLFGDAMPPYQLGPKGYREYLKMQMSNAQVIFQSLQSKSKKHSQKSNENRN